MTTPPHPRVEPSLQPPALAVPQRRQKSAGAPRKRSSLGAKLFWLLLFLVALPPLYVLALRWLPPPTTTFMLQSEVRVDYRWVPATRIAEHARKAVVAAEDQKFWTHQGFDIEAMEKAYVHNQKSRRRRGGSTITQQVAKNLFLWPGGGYFRKGVEATFTVLIEALWSKQRILEVYLNVAEFGAGIYGVEAAAQLNFGKSAAALSAQEAAQLAAVLPSPRRWKIRSPGPYVQARVRWIMRQMGYGQQAPVSEPEPEPPLDTEESMPTLDSWTDPLEESPEPIPLDESQPVESPPQESPPQESAPTEEVPAESEPVETEAAPPAVSH